MNNLPENLRADYEFDLKRMPIDRFSHPCIQYEDVLRAHYLICDYFQSNEGISSLHGVKDVNLLCSAVARQDVGFCGETKWKDGFEIAATLFLGLIKNHAFHDGNKRTALLVLIFQLWKMGRLPDAPQREFEKLTVLLADSQWSKIKYFPKKTFPSAMDEIDEVVRCVARLLRKYTRRKDIEFRPVTYAELERVLKIHGFHFGHPDRNSIDIIKRRRKTNFFGFRTKEYVEEKCCTVTFPGMKRQVSRESLKEILKKLNLDERHGFDRKSIFDGGESLYNK